jgi:hypothetical protein
MMLQSVRDWLRRIDLGKWAPHLTVGIAGYLAGVSSLPLFRHIALDGGVATLLGSALGAGLTVAGSVWVARYQISARERSFARFVADASMAIRDEAYVLISLLEISDWGDNAAYAEKIKKQVGYLNEAIELFRRNAPFSDIGNYDARLWLSRLEETIQNNLRILDKELKWLDRPTTAVIGNTRSDLGAAATAIFEACVHVGRELHHSRPLPSDEEVEQHLALLEP